MGHCPCWGGAADRTVAGIGAGPGFIGSDREGTTSAVPDDTGVT